MKIPSMIAIRDQKGNDMFRTLPKDPIAFMQWTWKKFQPYYKDLVNRPLTATTISEWVMDWSDLSRMLSEMYARLWVATTLDTTDLVAKNNFKNFLDGIFTASQAKQHKLKQKLLASGLHPEGFDIALRNIRVETDIYRRKNLPLLAIERMLVNDYDEMIGTQTVEWEGREVTVAQLQPIFYDLDRTKREVAWRLTMQRWLDDRAKLNDLWIRMMNVRESISHNAGYPDYRAYRWKQLLRFDYTPDDCLMFHRNIEQVVVPAARRIYSKRQHRLGQKSLRPWDLSVDPLGRAPLKPYQKTSELEEKVSSIFHQVDPVLGQYFETMRQKGLLDLENRKGKAPGAYCSNYDLARLPFIFENAVGLHEDVITLLHEGGHAFHVFEEAHLPYYHQLPVGIEFAEVASTAMEWLASPYLGRFYSESDAARAQIEHLEEQVLFWPYMAVVDAFQHWAYTNQTDAIKPNNCDIKWAELWERFMPGVDWKGLKNLLVTGWQRKPHIFEEPFYYVEYGLASLGAFQVWRNAQKNHKEAVASYRRALALGGTVSLPELYTTAGARLSFEADTLQMAVDMIENKIEELEKA